MEGHLEEQYKGHSSQPAEKSAQHRCPLRQVILRAQLYHTSGPSRMFQAPEESALPCRRPELWEERPPFAGYLTTRPRLKFGSDAQL